MFYSHWNVGQVVLDFFTDNDTCQSDYYWRLCDNKCNRPDPDCHNVCGCVKTTVTSDTAPEKCDGMMNVSTQTFITKIILCM